MEELLDVDGVSKILNVPRSRVYALVETRDPAERLPAVRLGSSLRFRAADIQAYIDARSEVAS